MTPTDRARLERLLFAKMRQQDKKISPSGVRKVMYGPSGNRSLTPVTEIPDQDLEALVKVYAPPAQGAVLEPNRALTRHRLERLAWEKTPQDYRGSSGTRREVLINTTEGTTLVPLADLTDYQIRRYIGPQALEEAGDMAKNGPGMYADTAAQEDDYVIWKHGSTNGYWVDWVRSGGKHTLISKNKGDPSVDAALETVRKHAKTHDNRAGVVFMNRDDDLAQIAQVNELHELPKSAKSSVRKPKFQLGDRVVRIDDPSDTGTVGFIGPWQGEEYGGYSIKVDRDNGGPRHFQPEDKLRLMRGGESYTKHSPNASREEPDEVAARELSLYIENEYSLVGADNSIGKAIEKNLLRKIKAGKFDLALSEKAWMYLMEAGAKKYSKEFSTGEREWSKIFNKPTRELVAHEFATTFAEEHGVSKAMARNASFEIEEFDAPAHWASAFINGDTSGLEDEDLAEFEEWVAKHPRLSWVVDVSEETHFRRWNGLQTELATYTAHVQPEELAPNARIERITEAGIIHFTDNDSTRAYVAGFDTRGKSFRTEGSPDNAHMQSLLARAKREGISVKKETW